MPYISRKWRETVNSDLDRDAVWNICARLKYPTDGSIVVSQILRIDNILTDESESGTTYSRLKDRCVTHLIFMVRREGVLRDVLATVEEELQLSFEKVGLETIYPVVPRLVQYLNYYATLDEWDRNPGNAPQPF